MADVTLRVVVDDSALGNLQTKVDQLNGKNVNVKTDPSGLKEMGKAADEASVHFLSLDKIAQSLQIRLVNFAVSKFVNGLREGLQIMKAVDDELVVVRKVSGAAADEMARIEQQAYKTASAYGVAANAYLESVASFTRAGYFELSEALAELSTKTQIVGDVEADVANQFLLAVDAAYDYKGSVEELNKVLDAANEIDNNFATSISKIAEGMGKVAPVASQMHVSANELMSAIGTITAVTQRSGTEAATALRALLLNIVGDTKTEIEEGVTWTTGEIAGLRDVLRQYAPDAVAAAEATGEIIDPMIAIGGLAQSMKDGLLTEQRLMEMVSDIGGKLRTSQLLALIQNWDMYNEMLEMTGDAAGSADKEVENALDSWSRKVEILKNTWAEFLSHLIETGTIKSSLDVLTGFVEFLDSGLGRAIITITATTAAFALLQHAINSVAASNFIWWVQSATESLASMRAAVTLLGESLLASPIAWVAAIGAAIYGLYALSDALNTTHDEAVETLNDINSEYAQSQSEYDALMARADTLTEKEKLRLDVLRLQTEEYKKQRGDAAQGVLDTFTSDTTYFTASMGGSGAGANLTRAQYMSSLIQQYGRLTTTTAESAAEMLELDDAISSNVAELADFVTEIDDLIAQGAKMSPELKSIYDQALAIIKLQTSEEGTSGRRMAELLMNGWTEADVKKFDKVYQDLIAAEREAAEAAEGFSEAQEENIADLISFQDELQGAISDIEAFNAALEGGEKGDTFKSYADIYKDFIEDWQAGLTGSNTVRGAIEAFLPDDILQDLEYDWKAAGEILASDFWQAVFAEEGEDYGANFANILYEAANEAGNVLDETGTKVLAHFEEVDGQLSMTVDSFSDLADYLGVDENLLYAIMDALDIFSGDLLTNRDSMISLAESVGALDEATKRVDLTKLIEGLAAAGQSEAQIWDIIHAMEEMGMTDASTEPKEGIGEYIDKCVDAQKATEETKSAVEELDSEKAEPSVGLDTTGFTTKVQYVLNTLSRLSNTPTAVRIGASAGGADNHPGGLTLVNEEGPEIIREGGRARVAGGGEPTLTYIEPGAQVFTAEETRQILRGRILSGEIAAMARGGGTTAGGIPTTARRTGVGNSPASTNTSSSAVTAASKELTEAQEDELDRLKSIVSLRESELSLLEEQGASAEEQADKLAEIAQAILDEENYLKAIGGDQEEINKLEVKRLQALKDIEKLKKQEFEDDISLLESELDLAEAQNRPTSERLDLMRQIQDKLHDEAEYMRDIGAAQEDINKLSKEWLDIQKEIVEVEFGEQISAMQTAYHLAEKQGKSVSDRIALKKEEQRLLHEEADRLRAIGASEEEINKISIEWWNAQEEILSIQKDLNDELQDAVDLQLEEARDARDAEIAALDKALEAMEAERDAKEQELTYEEKLLAVEKARADLANAQNERTIRMFNAATGQWEWIADPSKIKSAEEALESAEKSLAEYESEIAYQAAVDAINARKDAINAAYDALEEEWDAIVKSLQEPTRSIEEILADIAENGTPQMKAAIDTTTELLGKLNNYINAAIGGTTGDSYTGNGATGGRAGTSSRNYATDTTDYSALMRNATSQEEFDYWAAQRDAKMAAQGIDPAAKGWATNAEIAAEAGFAYSGSATTAASNSVLNARDRAAFASFMAGVNTSGFNSRLSGMGLVYGSANRAAGLLAGSVAGGASTIGDTYQFGDVILSEQQARQTTAYDLAQMSRSLGLYKWK